MNKTKIERLQSAIFYLQNNQMLDSKGFVKDIINKMGMHPNSVRGALRGEEKYLTSKFIRNFCSVFGNVISPDWIMTGIGDMVCVSDDLFSSAPEIPEETLNRLTKDELVMLVKQLMELHQEQNDIYRQMLRQNEEMIRNSQMRISDITKLIYKSA